MYESPTDLEQLYCEAGPALVAYFRQRPGLAAGAEDLAQDTFVKAFKNQERLRQAISPRAFLFGIARHVCLDALRRKNPFDTLEGDPAAVVEREDPRLEPMREAIKGLPEAMRETLMLKLQQELSYAEIAEVLDVPLGTVRSRLHQAVERLRQDLKPQISTP